MNSASDLARIIGNFCTVLMLIICGLALMGYAIRSVIQVIAMVMDLSPRDDRCESSRLME